ncbi:MAG: glutamate racemase [Sphingobacteriales bacterium]|nr:MAG: glutamate racemase [Sphingobacteriales bacterium]
MSFNNKSIGVFDSGFGGLTVFSSIAKKLPQYNYIYLGDNARSPYGDYDFDTVYKYTLECVEWLFTKGCSLVILACNTASAKALRTIQQNDLPSKYPNNRVLGVIRPTAEVIFNYTQSKHVGILGTRGTINSNSYKIELNKFSPNLQVYQQSCPMWVPLIENNEHLTPAADVFVKEYVNDLLKKSNKIDCILLACTHYPLLIPKIEKYLPHGIQLLSQGEIVAYSLVDYLNRHPEIDEKLIKEHKKEFFTSGDTQIFNKQANQFFGEEIQSKQM